MFAICNKNGYGIYKLETEMLSKNEIKLTEEQFNKIVCPCKLNIEENEVVDWEECELPDNLFDDVEPMIIEKTETDILKEENAFMKKQIEAMTSNQTFLEDCIVELAQEIYK